MANPNEPLTMQSYAAYISHLNTGNTTPKFTIKRKSSLKSLIGENIQVADLQTLLNQNEIINAFNKAINTLGSTPQDKQLPKQAEALGEVIRLLQPFTSNSAISAAYRERIDSFLNTLKHATFTGNLRTQFNSIIGYLGEGIVREELLKPNGAVAKALADNAVLTALEASADGRRKNVNVSYGASTFGPGFSINKSGATPITDIKVQLKSGGKGEEVTGIFNVSVKTSASTKETTNIRAWSTSLGTLLTKVFSDSYEGYGFYRLFGRRGFGQISEVTRYLAIKNLEEAVLGAGLDKITDFVINGKLYSAQEVMNKIVKQINSKNRMMVAMQGKNAPPEPLSSNDLAIQTWIENSGSKMYIDSTNNLQVVFDFTDLIFN